MNETSSFLSSSTASSAAGGFDIPAWNKYSSAVLSIAYCVVAVLGFVYAEFFRRTRQLEFRKYHVLNREFKFNFYHGTIVCACLILLLRGLSFLQYVWIKNYWWFLHVFQHITHAGMVTMLSFLFCVWLHHYRTVDVCEKFIRHFHIGLWIANGLMYTAGIVLFIVDVIIGNVDTSKYKFVYILFTLTAFLSGVWGLRRFVTQVLPKRLKAANETEKWDIEQDAHVLRTMGVTTLAIGIILGVNLIIMVFLAFIRFNQIFSLFISMAEKVLELIKVIVVIISVRHSSQADNITEKNHPLLEDNSGHFDI